MKLKPRRRKRLEGSGGGGGWADVQGGEKKGPRKPEKKH